MLAASRLDLKFLSELVLSLDLTLRIPVDSFMDRLCFILTLAFDLKDTFPLFLDEAKS